MEKLIEYNTAVLAKQKGFDWPVRDYFNGDRGARENIAPMDFNLSEMAPLVSRPTQAYLATWLRKVHFIHVNIMTSSFGWKFSLHNVPNNPKWRVENIYTADVLSETFNDVMEAALLEALKRIP